MAILLLLKYIIYLSFSLYIGYRHLNISSLHLVTTSPVQPMTKSTYIYTHTEITKQGYKIHGETTSPRSGYEEKRSTGRIQSNRKKHKMQTSTRKGVQTVMYTETEGNTEI